MARVLVVDDDLAIREMVAITLTQSGHDVARAASVAEAKAALAAARVDLIICDIYMPGGDGLALLEEVRGHFAPPPVILMTARGTVETAALAARTGAFDYLAKPFDLKLLLERVGAALAPRAAASETPEAGPESMIVGSHPAIVDVYKAIAKVAPLAVPVLVLGETGTGKELVARALHRFGAHPEGPFVPVHCGAIPDSLLESELFGHVRGAFTDAHRERTGAFAQANGGTVFLDEIGDVSQAFQVKLLRFLQDGIVRPLGADHGEETSVRVVAATNRDLQHMVSGGTFRQDLYFRLAGYEIRLPPLRARVSDVPVLVELFRRRAAMELGKPDVAPAGSEVLALMAAHPWPGNVRELEHVVRRLLIDTGSLADVVAARRALAQPENQGAAPDAVPAAGTGPTAVSLDGAERAHILAVLRTTAGNRSRAARLLGIERKTLARKLKKLGISLEELQDGRGIS